MSARAPSATTSTSCRCSRDDLAMLTVLESLLSPGVLAPVLLAGLVLLVVVRAGREAALWLLAVALCLVAAWAVRRLPLAVPGPPSARLGLAVVAYGGAGFVLAGRLGRLGQL